MHALFETPSMCSVLSSDDSPAWSNKRHCSKPLQDLQCEIQLQGLQALTSVSGTIHPSALVGTNTGIKQNTRNRLSVAQEGLQSLLHFAGTRISCAQSSQHMCYFYIRNSKLLCCLKTLAVHYTLCAFFPNEFSRE